MHTAAREKNVALLDLLNRILDKGVIICGDVTISVADVDLVYLGLKVMLSSVETMERLRLGAAASSGAGQPMVMAQRANYGGNGGD